jgi:biotin synthase
MRDMKEITLIKAAKEKALRGELLDREVFIKLLEIDPLSKSCDILGEAADEVAKAVTKGQAYIWGAIGIDYHPCPMNCNYCSLGEKWGIVKEDYELPQGAIIDIVRKYVEQKVRWIVLRTTQFYSTDKLKHLVERIRRDVAGEYELVINIGEFNSALADEFYDSGVDCAYHTLRLREGRDTAFNPDDRIGTMKSIKDSKLKLVSLVEPIGTEHSNEEIAEALYNIVKYDAAVSGAMQRIPVKGTPLGELDPISERRLAQIIGAIRLALNYKVKDICVHMASETSVKFGANVVVVETGAVPRDDANVLSEDWNEFCPMDAERMFNAHGYKVIQRRESI